MTAQIESQMDRLFGIYLNQDYAYWGGTLEAVIDCYKKDSNVEEIEQLIQEIAAFRSAHAGDLDSAFDAAHGFDFSPGLWDYDTDGFFSLLVRLLSPGR